MCTCHGAQSQVSLKYQKILKQNFSCTSVHSMFTHEFQWKHVLSVVEKIKKTSPEKLFGAQKFVFFLQRRQDTKMSSFFGETFCNTFRNIFSTMRAFTPTSQSNGFGIKALH